MKTNYEELARKYHEQKYSENKNRIRRITNQYSEVIPGYDQLVDSLSDKKESFRDCLFRLMDAYHLERSDLTAKIRANESPVLSYGVSQAVLSKWINNDDEIRTPDKATVYAIILRAKLKMKDAVALLRSANLEFGYTPEDIIVKHFIEIQKFDDLRLIDDLDYEITGKPLFNKRAV